MSAKQDRTYTRTASDLERKLNLKERFLEVMGIATDAQKKAEEADGKIAKLDQETVFNLLTNNGQSQGLFRGADGELYINASYIASGIIGSKDGKIQIDLSGLTGPIFNTGISTNGILVRGDAIGAETLFELSANQVDGRDFAAFLMNNANGYTIVQISEDSTQTGGGVQVMNDSDTISAIMQATNASAGLRMLKDGVTKGYLAMNNSGVCVLQTDIINPGKKVLFTGNVARGGTFTVPDTDCYDLFAIKVSADSKTKPGVILAYKDGNTIYGMGGWGGDSANLKETYWVSITFDKNTWTLVHGSYHALSLSNGWGDGTAINVVEVKGII